MEWVIQGDCVLTYSFSQSHMGLDSAHRLCGKWSFPAYTATRTFHPLFLLDVPQWWRSRHPGPVMWSLSVLDLTHMISESYSLLKARKKNNMNGNSGNNWPLLSLWCGLYCGKCSTCTSPMSAQKFWEKGFCVPILHLNTLRWILLSWCLSSLECKDNWWREREKEKAGRLLLKVVLILKWKSYVASTLDRYCISVPEAPGGWVQGLSS